MCFLREKLCFVALSRFIRGEKNRHLIKSTIVISNGRNFVYRHIYFTYFTKDWVLKIFHTIFFVLRCISNINLYRVFDFIFKSLFISHCTCCALCYFDDWYCCFCHMVNSKIFIFIQENSIYQKIGITHFLLLFLENFHIKLILALNK